MKEQTEYTQTSVVKELKAYKKMAGTGYHKEKCSISIMRSGLLNNKQIGNAVGGQQQQVFAATLMSHSTE